MRLAVSKFYLLICSSYSNKVSFEGTLIRSNYFQSDSQQHFCLDKWLMNSNYHYPLFHALCNSATRCGSTVGRFLQKKSYLVSKSKQLKCAHCLLKGNIGLNCDKLKRGMKVTSVIEMKHTGLITSEIESFFI